MLEILKNAIQHTLIKARDYFEDRTAKIMIVTVLEARTTTFSTLGLLFIAVLASTVMTTTVYAGPDAPATPFTAGSTRLSVELGGATAFNQNYSIFGIGGGYFVADGIEVGLDFEEWYGNSPHIEQVSPQARYVLRRDGIVQPYVGAFYRRTLIQGYPGQDTVGIRAGVYFLTGRRAYLGAGLAQEEHLNCNRTVYSSCSETYPELLFAIIF
ncbi:MAG TPA: hypothetical protein VEI57_02350 [Nitrospirota bacterium]|nr:hypothetical protein [Nitrospirota bacterium]